MTHLSISILFIYVDECCIHYEKCHLITSTSVTAFNFSVTEPFIFFYFKSHWTYLNLTIIHLSIHLNQISQIKTILIVFGGGVSEVFQNHLSI